MADKVRMIDKDKLIKKINAEIDAWAKSRMCMTADELLETIEEFEEAAEPDNGWISVDDRLPRLGQRVMAFCRAGILTFLRYDGEVWFEMSSRNEYLLSFVTHWQHLPEPPKGE